MPSSPLATDRVASFWRCRNAASNRRPRGEMATPSESAGRIWPLANGIRGHASEANTQGNDFLKGSGDFMGKTNSTAPSARTNSGLTMYSADGTSFFDSLVTDTGPWPPEVQQNRQQIPPGIDPKPIPTMMDPGHPGIPMRWEELGHWLRSNNKTRPEQMARLQKLKQLLRDDREDPPSVERTEAIRALREQCVSPFISDPHAQLFACFSGMGLIFVYDRPRIFDEALRKALKNGGLVLLFRLNATLFGAKDEIFRVSIGDSAPFPWDQTLLWAEAAAAFGYLFSVAQDADEWMR
jgi:hypothetical protein